MEQRVNMFVCEKANVSVEDARMSVLKFRVTEVNGEQHVQFDGQWVDIIAAFMNSDIIVADSLPN